MRTHFMFRAVSRGWPASVVLLLIGLPTVGAEDLVVTFVGLQRHGTAVVVQAPGGATYLVDTGPAGGTYDAGRDTLWPLLGSRGVKEVEAIVVSHPHNDHYGGARWLVEHVPVKRLIDTGYDGRGQSDAYRALRRLVRERGGETIAAHAGDRLDWGPELSVEVLSPPREFLLQDADPAAVSEHSVLNNNSLVLRIQHGENVFLFPGDAYGSEGSYLLRHWPAEKLRTNVLCAPHHGFNATPGYAAVVRPEVVVASCLAHYDDSAIASPGEQAAKVFGPVGAKVYSTAVHGSVRVVSNGRSLSVHPERTPTPSPAAPRAGPSPTASARP